MNLHRVGEPQTPNPAEIGPGGQNGIGGQNGGQIDHDFEEEDEDMMGVHSAGTEDLLVPGLDYEVSFLVSEEHKKMQNILLSA